MATEAQTVPNYVMAAFARVRDSGACNMMSFRDVQYWMDKNKDSAAVIWMQDHKNQYWDVLSNFDPDIDYDNADEAQS